MTKDKLVLAFAGILALCVIGLGFAGQFRPADLHEFDILTGLPTTIVAADCNDHSASAAR